MRVCVVRAWHLGLSRVHRRLQRANNNAQKLISSSIHGTRLLVALDSRNSGAVECVVGVNLMPDLRHGRVCRQVCRRVCRQV